MPKQRTRSHIIADLSYNHVERFVLRCGFTAAPVRHDYGTDMEIYTFDSGGYVEEEQIACQLKATDRLQELVLKTQEISIDIENKHLESWRKMTFPFFLIVYDALMEQAFWLYVQQHWQRIGKDRKLPIHGTTAMRIPLANVVNDDAILKFVQFRNRIKHQIKMSGVRHDA